MSGSDADFSITNTRPAPPAYNAKAAVVDGALLWMRQWQLTVGPQSGQNSVDLSLLGFAFEVEQARQIRPPWSAKITIYNVGQNIISRMQKELTHVRLEAGYRAPSRQYGTIFQGGITYYKHGRLNATDSFVEIHSASADVPINNAVINTTLPAGHTKRDVLNALAAVLAPYGVELGEVTDMGDDKSPRARTLSGMVVDVLRDVSHTVGGHAHIDDDMKLHLLKGQEAIDKGGAEDVTVLNSRSGLIGVPTLAMGAGLEARSLLNPLLRVGKRVKIDEAAVTRTVGVNTDMMPEDTKKLMMTAFRSDGFYLTWKLRHFGENRGTNWYTDIVTEPLDPTQMAPGLRTST